MFLSGAHITVSDTPTLGPYVVQAPGEPPPSPRRLRWWERAWAWVRRLYRRFV